MKRRRYVMREGRATDKVMRGVCACQCANNAQTVWCL